MFEFFIAKKYLIPKKKQLSVSLIALMSVAVISLVVWLVLIFLSVTEGIEKNWLQKLTSLNAPIRITPTNHYYHSYYHHIDSISAASGYAHKSLNEKLLSEISNPYDPEEDQEIPSFWPQPDLAKDGSLKDPVKQAFKCFNTLTSSHPDLVAQNYEITGALLKLRLIRPISLTPGSVGDDQQSFLTQMSYIASFSEKSPFFHSLLLPPSAEDINHLFYLSSLTAEDTNLDLPKSAQYTKPLVLQKRLKDLFGYLQSFKMLSSNAHFKLSKDYLKEGTTLQAVAFLKEGNISHFLIPTKKKEIKTSHQLLYGTLEKKGDHLFFFAKTYKEPLNIDAFSLYIEDPIEFEASLLPASLDYTYDINDVELSIKATLQNQPIEGIASFGDLTIQNVSATQSFEKQPSEPPLWPYFVNNICYLPSQSLTDTKDHSVLLPKNFKESGVRIGDKGFLSYGVATANSMQEQRLSIYVAGFYDPGIMAVGSKCILMNRDVVHSIAASSNSFAIDQNMTSGIQVWFKDLNQTTAIADELKTLFKQEGIDRYFTISTFYEYDFAKDLLQQFQSDKYLFTLIGIIILVVACSNIISFLVLMVNDKKKEIGILQSMGASAKSIALIFAVCGVTLGLLGSIIGTAAAFLTMHHIDSVVGLLSLLQGHEAFHEHFYGDALPNKLSSQAVLFILISTPILSVLAGLVPAIKACRLRPALTLRSE